MAYEREASLKHTGWTETGHAARLIARDADESPENREKYFALLLVPNWDRRMNLALIDIYIPGCKRLRQIGLLV
jgi:hypothetical protein